MGLFSGLKKAFKKIVKGVKKVVKKVARGIKKVVKGIGKFVGKLGIVGQIGLGLLLPGVGAMFGKTAGWLMKASNPLLKGAGKFLNAAINVGTKAGNVFKTITGGVTKVVGHVVGSAANALGLDVPFKNLTASLGVNDGKGIDISGKNFRDTFKVVGEEASKLAESGRDLFSMDTLTGTNKFTAEQWSKDLTKKTPKIESIVTDTTNTEDLLMSPAENLPEEMSLVSKNEIVDAASAQSSAIDAGITTSESLLAKETTKKTFKQAITELPGKLKDEAILGISKAPEKLVTKLIEAPGDYIETRVLSEAQVAAGAIPDQSTTVYNASVPTLNTSTADIGTGGYETGFNPNMYTSNINYVSQNPYGQTATLHNAYQNYMRGAV